MKKTNSIIATLVVILVIYFLAFRTKETSYNEGLRFCESTLFYDGGLLVANFGSSELNPLNLEGKGYISHFKENKITTLIPSDGNLNAPKGMLIDNDLLYICDVNKIVIYNLNRLDKTPQSIIFPEGEMFLNDLVKYGEDIYVSVTNTGNIYKFTASDLTPKLWINIVGANGIAVSEDIMYVASYPANGVISDDNVIYKVSDINGESKIEKLITQQGAWDGIAVSKDNKTLYASNWTPASVISVNLKSGEITPLKIKEPIVGAADFTLVGNLLCIPDLATSKLIIRQLK